MASPSAIAWARQSGVKLAANHLLDQPANPVTNSALDGIKPIVEKMGVTLGRRMRKLRCRGNVLHGVVSCPALQRWVIRGSSPGDYATINSYQPSDGTLQIPPPAPNLEVKKDYRDR